MVGKYRPTAGMRETYDGVSLCHGISPHRWMGDVTFNAHMNPIHRVRHTARGNGKETEDSRLHHIDAYGDYYAQKSNRIH